MQAFTLNPKPEFMNQRLVGIALLLMTGTPFYASEKAGSAKPNVVFILADDLGWSDTTLYGTTAFYRTPNIQRLAERGMTFTRAYSASPLCSPTRASILTGLSPARHGITSPGCHTPVVRLEVELKAKATSNLQSIQPESITRLAPSHTTIAETLRAEGYATAHFGKWHLGAEPYSPLEHGFDVDVPHWHGPGPAGSYVAPWKFKDFDHDPDIPDEHIEDRMAKEAVAFLEEHHDEPFFLNYWMFSVHAPFDAKQSLIEKYGKSVDSEDEQRCPTYAAMIESMDDAVGTLIDALDRLGVCNNTIVIFASDNGGNTYNLVDGQRPTSNRPLRGGKATMYEGGIRTPAIIVWPAYVEPASRSDVVIQSMDFFPTLLDLLQIEAKDNQTFDGISLRPALQGGELNRQGIFTYFPHNPPVPDWMPPAISIHQGSWKLIRIFHGGAAGAHRYKLFDLSRDVGEQQDLSQSRPEKVRELDALIEAHLQATGAIVPAANPDFDPVQYDPKLEGVPASKFQPGGESGEQAQHAVSIAGWQAGGTCQLSRAGKALRVQSTGRDPFLSYTFVKPVPAGNFSLKIHMRAEASGNGQVFWRSQGTRFAADRSESFEIQHDKVPHTYSIEFSSALPLQSVRIDPARGTGTIDMIQIQLLDAGGQTIQQWNF